MSLSAILATAALLVQDQQGWMCGASVTVGKYKGWVSRDYLSEGDHEPYRMEIKLPGASDAHTISWTIDPRPAEPPPGTRRPWPAPRKQAEAFRDGPDAVHFTLEWGPGAAAPIWAHYWGDGVYAGADLLASPRMMRRRIATNTQPFGSDGGLLSRRLLRALAPAREWTVAVTDRTGKTLSSRTFEVPTWRQAEAAFGEARARIDATELRYRAGDPVPPGEASCTSHPDPAAIVRLSGSGSPDPA